MLFVHKKKNTLTYSEIIYSHIWVKILKISKSRKVLIKNLLIKIIFWHKKCAFLLI